MANPFRRACAGLPALVLSLLAFFLNMAALRSEPSVRDTPKEFITALSQRGLAILRDESLDKAAKAKKFRALYHAHFDRDAIASLVLGRASSDASPAERREMRDLLDAYISGLLVDRLGEYFGGFDGIVWSVDYWTTDGADVVVYSHIVRSGKHLNVRWRLRQRADGTLKIRDVYFEHISLALTQKREFEKLFYAVDSIVAVFIEKLKELLRLPRGAGRQRSYNKK